MHSSLVRCFEPAQLAAMGRACDTASEWLDANMSAPPEHGAVARCVLELAKHGIANEAEMVAFAIQLFYLPVVFMMPAHNEKNPAAGVMPTAGACSAVAL